MPHDAAGEGHRIGLLSLRSLNSTPVGAVDVEVEDVVCSIDDVDLIQPRPTRLSPVANRLATNLSRRSPLGARINPGFSGARPGGRYELFAFLTRGGADDLIVLNSVPGWRRSCDRAVCVIRELWREDLPRVRNQLRVLDLFDQVFVEYYESVEAVQACTKTPVSFIAPSLNAEMLCPLPHPPSRSIDVYNIGRRIDSEHRPLLEAMVRGDLFYYYTTIQPDRAWDPFEHRLLLANVLKRSRYAIVHPAKFNETWRRQQEIGFRYFEAAAAGVVMLGTSPGTEAFTRLFPWPEAVIEFEEGAVLQRMRDLDDDPQRTTAIRRDGIRNSLLLHDSVYRWEQLLASVGMELQDAGKRRKEALAALAAGVDSGIS